MKNWIFILLLLVAFNLHGKKRDSTLQKMQFDTSYITDLTQKLTLKTYLVDKSNTFTVSHNDNDGNGFQTEYKPNDGSSIGFGFNYKWLGFSMAFIPLGRRDFSTHGRTQRLDLQGNIYTRKFGFDLRFQYYKGFYIDNPQNLDENWVSDSGVPTRFDIRTANLGANMFYVFNHQKFSFRNSFVNNEWQTKSSGSFYAGTAFSFYSIAGDSAIAPTELVDSLVPEDFFMRANILTLGGFGGYAYNFIIQRKFFVSLAMAPGLSTLRLREIDAEGEEFANSTKLAFRFNTRIGMGYNSERFFSGISYFNDFLSFNYNQNESSFSFASGAFRLYVGYRFL
ncbi:DUF4421 family protein [bacterium SCSIO 12741]|nr:DUF4421 family protein [bacterium SCSIO 12741]